VVPWVVRVVRVVVVVVVVAGALRAVVACVLGPRMRVFRLGCAVERVVRVVVRGAVVVWWA
jgi:hypothetical protein